jgi:hypothetical protein
MFDIQIGEANLANVGILKEIESTGRPLQACAEDEHPHPVFSTAIR